MDRRTFSKLATGGLGALLLSSLGLPLRAAEPVEKVRRSNEEWRRILTPEQYNVLREEGTEAPFSSRLNDEKHSGLFLCVACDLALFSSQCKFDSGTGWPSFWAALPGHLETRLDYAAGTPRVEYHCASCGGHHGHVFNDGPRPTGLRYCSNGVALRFVPGRAGA